MPNLDVTFTSAIKDYLMMFDNFKVFPVLTIAALVFVLMIAINLNNKNSHFLFYGLNILLIILICWTHGLDIINNIDTFFNSNLFENIYFYLANMVISLLVVSKGLQSKRIENPTKYVIVVLYYFLLVTILHTLYVSNYLNNIMLLVIGNTYPMVYLGNITAFLIYLVLISYWLFAMKKRKKHRLGNHL